MRFKLFIWALLVLWVVSSLLLFREQKQERVVLTQQLIQRSQDMALTLEGILKRFARAPLHKGPMLQKTLDDLIKLGSFESLALMNHERKVLMHVGKEVKIPLVETAFEAPLFLKKEKLCILMMPLELDVQGEMEKRRREDDFFLPRHVRERLEEWRTRKGDDRMPRISHIGITYFVTITSTKELEQQLKAKAFTKIIISLFFLLAILAIGLFWKRQKVLQETAMELLEQKRQNESLEEKSLAAAGLAHEMRTPLGLVRGLTQMMLTQDLSPEQQRENHELVLEEVDRSTSRLNDFMAYSRMRTPELEHVELLEVIHRMERLLEDDLSDGQLTLKYQLDPSGHAIQVDREQFEQVMINVLQNAISFSPAGGCLNIISKRLGQELNLSICDDGPGVPKDQLERVFQPYVTNRDGGTGLGLAIVRQIIEGHGAKINIENLEAGGACVRIRGLKISPSVEHRS